IMGIALGIPLVSGESWLFFLLGMETTLFLFIVAFILVLIMRKVFWDKEEGAKGGRQSRLEALRQSIFRE
ncbi:MAG: hypothetical protein DRP11_03765, partial [Candidatus Aenigmatarchaeota archaeon]